MTQAGFSEVAALCEWPVVLEGRFDPKFLALPRAVLVSAIETNQRYFLLEGPDGRLLPKFLFVANLESAQPAVVVAGNERVIVPRLSDERLLLCLTIRDEDLGADGVARRRRLSRAERFTSIALGRLGREELAQWLRSALGGQAPEPELVEHLERHTEGNPLFAVQTAE